MRVYNQAHEHDCGIDLHVKTMPVCILDASGRILLHRNVRSTPEAFRDVVAPYRQGLVVAVECMFTWYWLRGGLLPQAYVYPATMRSTRDLLRRRLHLVRKRGELLAHIQNTRAQYNLPVFEKRLAYAAHRVDVLEHFPDPSVRTRVEVDVSLIDHDDGPITDLALTIVREAKRHDADAFHRLRSVPGIGKILALTILYEIHDITRFERVQEFASYARLVKS